MNAPEDRLGFKIGVIAVMSAARPLFPHRNDSGISKGC